MSNDKNGRSMHSKPLSRELYLSLIQSALAVQHFDFSVTASLHWLGRYPGDLHAGLLYAKALIGKKRTQQARPILSGLISADPEYLDAIQTMVALELSMNNPDNQTGKKNDNEQKQSRTKSKLDLYATWLYALKVENERTSIKFPKSTKSEIQDWGKYLRHANLAKGSGDLDQAEKMLILAIGANPPTPLIYLNHLRFLEDYKNIPLAARLNLARHYHEIWPGCLSIALLAAHWMIEAGEHDQAVKLIHQVMSRDIGGQVAQNLWGENHPYITIWPRNIELNMDIPIPAEVATRMGWNQLPEKITAPSKPSETHLEHTEALPAFLVEELSQLKRVQRKSKKHGTSGSTNGKPNHSAGSKERLDYADLIKVRKDLEILAHQINRPGITQLDGRFPVYLILSIRNSLEKKFGTINTDKIITEMYTLADCISKRSQHDMNFNWVGSVYLADDPDSAQLFGLDPIETSDPWSIKLALADLDDALSQQGEMIGALLIIGGPEIVPFHHLPNPVDDPDDFVHSDNPYGTRDENYFVLEWPVGRLPDGRGTDPNLLLNGLRNIQKYHTHQTQKIHFLQVVWRKIRSLLPDNGTNGSKSLGYSAAVWRVASQSVYRTIGDPRQLYTSPPMGGNGNGSRDYQIPPLTSPRLGYFNLHGIIDSGEWYGQSEISDGEAEFAYPIALRPEDIRSNGKKDTKYQIPEFVFSEACYGAHISGKSIESALSLSFLAAGSSAYIGSSCMSYGSVNPPLIAADLLGHSFWKFMREGLVAGEALRQAKIFLAHEMHQRQGYLDGEDQKTLISFVLYGDPLAHFQFPEYVEKGISRLVGTPEKVITVCDRASESTNEKQIPVSDIEKVRHIVEQYLPGMSEAQLVFSSERSVCHGRGHICPTSQLRKGQTLNNNPDRKVYTLSKQTTKNAHIHKQFARITLDGSGRVVKLVVSR